MARNNPIIKVVQQYSLGFLSGKGGSGKSLTAFMTSTALKSEGYSVCLIDTDAQRSINFFASDEIRINNINSMIATLQKNIATWLRLNNNGAHSKRISEAKEKIEALEDSKKLAVEYLDLTNPDISKIVDELESIKNKHSDKDFLIFDFKGELTSVQSALVTSLDLVLVPFRPKALEVQGVLPIIQLAANTPKTEFTSILITSSKSNLSEVSKALLPQIFEAVPMPDFCISESVVYENAIERGLGVSEILVKNELTNSFYNNKAKFDYLKNEVSQLALFVINKAASN